MKYRYFRYIQIPTNIIRIKTNKTNKIDVTTHIADAEVLFNNRWTGGILAIGLDTQWQEITNEEELFLELL